MYKDDNARLHQANIASHWFEVVEIYRMDQLANSPDGNPNEHVWDELGRRIASKIQDILKKGQYQLT